jgi:2-dehydropantoate 2-reductase
MWLTAFRKLSSVNKLEGTMRVLIVGAGVIGTVYGAHLASAGHAVSVLSHPPRTQDVARNGLIAHDVLEGSRTDARVSVVPDAAGTAFDLVLVAIRSDQLAAACSQLTGLAGSPAVVFFGNNPGGRPAVSGQVRGDVMLGFPGVGGAMRDGTAEYVRIRQQPTAMQAGTDTRLEQLARALGTRGFAVQRVADMDGWLAYHAAFVACVAAALYRCDTDPGRLAADRPALRLMCAAVTEAFAALRRMGVTGLPRNLAVLHNPLLKAVAVRYWAHTMRSPMGELCFAAHARHAEAEMRALGDQLASRIGTAPAARHLRQLLKPAPAEAASHEEAAYARADIKHPQS